MKRLEILGATVTDTTIQSDCLWAINLKLVTGKTVTLKTPYFRSLLLVSDVETAGGEQ